MKRFIFYFVFLSTAFFFQGGNPNTNSRFNLARALALHGTIQIDDYAVNTVDKSFRDGHYYSDKAPGVAIAAAAIIGALRPVVESLPESWGFDRRVKDTAYLIFICLALLAALSGFTATRFYQFTLDILRQSTGAVREQQAAVLTLITFLTTLLLPYGTILFSHQTTACLLFLLFEQVVRLWIFKEAPLHIWGHLALAAIVALTEFPAAVPAAAAYGALTLKLSPRKRWLAPLPGAVLLALFGFYNWKAFGSPFSIGYGNLGNTPFEAAMNQGFFGIRLPRLDRVVHLLFSGYRGLFYYNPVLIFAAIGVGLAWRSRQRAIAALIAGCCLYFLTVNVSYSFWQGGACIGPRHMVPMIPILAVGFAFLGLEWIAQPVFWLVAILSWVFMVVSSSVNVVPPEELTNPFWNELLPQFKMGNLSVSQFPLLAGEAFLPSSRAAIWSSFNLGELVFGLVGKGSLLPLVVFQSVMVWVGFRSWVVSGLHVVRNEWIKDQEEREWKPHPALVPFSLILLVYLFRAYPWDLAPGWLSQYRPMFDPVDVDVFMKRGQWAVQGLRPYVDVFAEYPIVPVLIFGAFARLTSDVVIFQALMVGLQAGLGWLVLSRLGRVYRRLPAIAGVMLLLPGYLYFSLNRFDFLVTSLLGALLYLLHASQFFWAGALLAGIGFVKWTPALIAPLIVLWLGREKGRKDVMAFVGGVALIGAVAMVAQIMWFGWEGFLIPLRWQALRNPNEGSLIFMSLFILKTWGVSAELRQILPNLLTALAGLSAILVLFKRKITLSHLALAMIVINCSFALFSKIYSPQWLVWNLIPWAWVIADRARRGVLGTATLGWISAEVVGTYLFFPVSWDLLGSTSIYFLIATALQVALRVGILRHSGRLYCEP